jgi:uncharacterized membrane protein YcjF (UPF0283 family)
MSASSVRWWFFRLGTIAISLFFVLFGVILLIGAYSMTIPHYFVMTFFAASFIILISGVILLGYSLQVVQRLRKKRPDEESEEVNTP